MNTPPKLPENHLTFARIFDNIAWSYCEDTNGCRWRQGCPRGETLQNDIQQQLKEIRDLPTLPVVFVRIMKVLRNSNASVKDIARVVEADQAITMKILRLINSSFYGLSRRMDSVQQAIVLLGANTLKNVVISASVFKALGGNSQNKTFNREAFWQHSIGCGMIARFLGNQTGCGREEEAFISGVIHDIGKVVLDQYFPDRFQAVLDCLRGRQISFYQAETEALGFSHAQVGAALAKIWGLPPNLVDVIGRHHEFEASAKHARLVALIQISNMLARQYQVGSGGDDTLPNVDPLAWHSLSLDPVQIIKWDDQLKMEIAKGAEFLDLMSK